MAEKVAEREWKAVAEEVLKLARFASSVVGEARTKEAVENINVAAQNILTLEVSNNLRFGGVESQLNYLNSVTSSVYQLERASIDMDQQAGVELLSRATRTRALIDELVRKLPESFVSRLRFPMPASHSREERVIEDRLARIHDTVQSALERSSDAAKRISSLDESLSDATKRVDAKFDNFNVRAENEFLALQSKLQASADLLQASHEQARVKLEEELKETEEFLGVLASKAIGGGYMRNAIKEERKADNFRKLAIAVMIALGLYLVLSIAAMEMKDLEPQRVAVRLVGVLFFSFVIGYLIRQSAVHRGQQHQYQRTAFDLKAIDPFVADLPESNRHLIKQQLAEKIFVPKDVLASIDSAGFGVQETLLKYLEKSEQGKDKPKGKEKGPD